jgi:hypothetical protein
MKSIVAAALVYVLIGSFGCYRTHYTNVAPPVVSAPSSLTPEKPRDQTWIHFFIYGWVPGEQRIDAAKQCGGAQHIKVIETEQRFVQGLIAIFASYYINIYSPWTGRVVCDNDPPASASTSADQHGDHERNDHTARLATHTHRSEESMHSSSPAHHAADNHHR